MFRCLALAFLALMFQACEEDADNDAPTFTVHSPVDGATVNISEGIPLHIVFNDNDELVQYKLVLDGIDSLNGIAADSMPRIVRIDECSGQEFTLDGYFPLPDSAFNGFYTLTITCADNGGNQAIADTLRLRLVNPLDSVPPVFSITQSPNDTLTFGEGFTIEGQVTDETSLNLVTVRLGPVEGDGKLTQDYSTIENNTVLLDGNIPWFNIDSTWATGQYVLYLTAWDNYNGVDHSTFFYVNY